MHLFARAYDGIHGTGLDTQGATNTYFFINYRHRAGFFFAVFRVEWLGLTTQEIGQSLDSCIAAGRALVNVCLAVSNGLCIGQATRVSALCTLGLRQQCINLVNHRIAFDPEPRRSPAQAKAEYQGQHQEYNDGQQYGHGYFRWLFTSWPGR